MKIIVIHGIDSLVKLDCGDCPFLMSRIIVQILCPDYGLLLRGQMEYLMTDDDC